MGNSSLITRRMAARDTFDKFDKKKDGSVPAADCGTAIRSMGVVCSDQEAEEHLRGLGCDGVSVNFEMFEKLEQACVAAEGDGEENAELKAEFKNFDKDGDGKITLEELIEALTKMADSDGDGHINFAEFKNAMKA